MPIDFSKFQEKPHPPIAPKPIKIQALKPPKPAIIEVVPEEDFFIDWDYLTRNSSFQRGFTEFIKHTFPQYKKIDHRASKKVMNQQLREKTNEITIALNVVNKIDSKLLRELRAKREM